MNESDGYRIDRLPSVNRQIRELVANASSAQERQELFDSLNVVLAKLSSQPIEWGDPEYKTRKAGGMVCHGLLPPLVVHYVVFQQERVVILLNITRIGES